MFRALFVAISLLGLTTGTSLALEAGDVDLAFGSSGTGRETVAFPPGSAHGYASTLAPDGSIYLGGAIILAPDNIDAGVTRLTAEGEFDPVYGLVQFDIPGYMGASVEDLVMQADGKLIVVGSGMNVGSGRWLVCRLLANGDLDTDFGEAQTPGCSLPLQGRATAAALLSDGRILVAGEDALGDPTRAALIRMEVDGSLDTSFAGGGTIAFLPEELSAQSSFGDLALTPDGGIAASGHYGPNGDHQFMVARFDADGVLQTAFSQDGVRLVNYTLLPPGERLNFVSALAVLPDGAIILSGTVYVPTNGGSIPRIGLVKLEADGTLSPDFVSQDFPDGQLLIDPCVQECWVSSSDMSVLPDGRILLVGSGKFGDLDIPALFSIRLTPQGQFDASYAANNFGEFAAGLSLVTWDDFELNEMLLQGDRIVMVGHRPNAQAKNELAALRIVGAGVFADGLESD